ncbi:MAG: Aminopeptidase [Mucilaginibacter sp.]|nr:Aminopeptidase [Mucilaginibacter sp.]
MKKNIIVTFLSCILLVPGMLNPLFAQEAKQPSIYQATTAKINDLVHTRLDLRFDYKKRYVYGKEWVTLKPHFYPTDTLRLDAKGMDIQNIAMVKNGINMPLHFSYDSLSLNIKLDKVYNQGEKYTIYLDYTAKPEQLKNVREDQHGIYFVNPDSSEKDKPVQIWSQGEPEGSSAWFPTIDHPNQKTTAEIVMTVPSRYVTLSNGRLSAQKNNGNGTRTDSWKMELPHAPYLFMVAVGDFRIHKDSWHGKEVSYYLEPKSAPFVKEIFGDTPEAIEFFSKVTGIDFPWNKYSEIAVRDYVSGAMENTTATMFGEQGKNKREFVDSYYNTGIEHELFHQWFGDYVTAESWSNLTLNESFADFGEIIWLEHKYGKDAADEHLHNGLQGYLNNPENAKKPLVNFYYKRVNEVFNGVTYQKGGRVLNMLRNYLKDAAFYKGLNIYLKTNAFKSADAQQLRLAMEEASGLDLNWFFTEWYYGAGHPVININYKWNDTTKIETVYLQQNQEGQTFTLPMAIDIYTNGKKERHQVWMRSRADTLTFKTPAKPDQVNVDADKVLVTKKTDNKTLDEFVFQYFTAPLYLDRFEAIEAASKNQDDKGAQKVLIAALNDKFSGLRKKTIDIMVANKEDIRKINRQLRNAAVPVLVTLAQNDKNTLVRASAIRALVPLKDPAYLQLFKDALNSESYEVAGSALFGIAAIDTAAAMKLAKGVENDNEGMLTQAIISIYSSNGTAAQWPFVYNKYKTVGLQDRIHLTQKFAAMIGRIDNSRYAQDGIEQLKVNGIKYKNSGAGPFMIRFLNVIKEQRTNLNDTASAKAADDAIKQINEAK